MDNAFVAGQSVVNEAARMLYSTRSPFVPKSERRDIFIVLIVLATAAGIAYFRANQPSGSDLFGKAHSVPVATSARPH